MSNNPTQHQKSDDQEPQAKRPLQVFDSLSASVWAFACLVSALEAGLLEALTVAYTSDELSQRFGIERSLLVCILDVLVSLELLEHDNDLYRATPEFQPLLHESARDTFFAGIRTANFQSQHMIANARNRTLKTGWSYTDPEVLTAQGIPGRAGFRMLAKEIFPRLTGLIEQLQRPGAAFLDVGTGIAAIALEMARLFPTLRVVGLEPQDQPLAEARRNVAAAGLGEQIELRDQRIEDLVEKDVYTLVWLPQVFLPLPIVKSALHISWQALQPSGWIILPVESVPGMDVKATLARLRNVLWGGEPLYPEQVAQMLSEANFSQVQIFEHPFGRLSKPIVVGQRPL